MRSWGDCEEVGGDRGGGTGLIVSGLENSPLTSISGFESFYCGLD